MPFPAPILVIYNALGKKVIIGGRKKRSSDSPKILSRVKRSPKLVLAKKYQASQVKGAISWSKQLMSGILFAKPPRSWVLTLKFKLSKLHTLYHAKVPFLGRKKRASLATLESHD